MQSYIYPAIAARINLYLVCELPADPSFFSQAKVQRQLDDQRGLPKELNGSKIGLGSKPIFWKMARKATRSRE
jgi:hypothetical protein